MRLFSQIFVERFAIRWLRPAGRCQGVWRVAFLLIFACLPCSWAFTAEGTLTITATDESSGEPTLARIELTRPTVTRPGARAVSRVQRVRKVKPLTLGTSVETGFGFVIDGSAKLDLHEAAYEFRVSRGPEYRVISGNFSIEKTSEDEHGFALPRILDMRSKGWTSGDCLVPVSRESLPIRMTAEDLHVVMTASDQAITDDELADLRATRERRELPALIDPMWIIPRAESVGGLTFYQPAASDSPATTDLELTTLQRLAQLASTRNSESPESAPENRGAAIAEMRVAIENPFTWPLPVYLASDQVDGYFVLGDWLRLDRSLMQMKDGRPFSDRKDRLATTLGREAEQIYWHLLNAGFRIVPLAGSGDEADLHPVGYNRLYVAGDAEPIGESKPVENATQWWAGAWAGRSFATNGPLLIASLDGHPPGHVFETTSANSFELTPELSLTVRDPVDYLEVIHNGEVHYSAKLDEYAKAKGKIPPIIVTESGWAVIRVVTLLEDHFRAATTAPWYFQFNGRQRVSKRSVDVFQEWLADYEEHLRSTSGKDLAAYAPFIRGARGFWQSRREAINAR